MTNEERAKEALADTLPGNYTVAQIECIVLRALNAQTVQHAKDTARFAKAAYNLKGQIEQARDGFGIWPYKDSGSMREVLAEFDAAFVIINQNQP